MVGVRTVVITGGPGGGKSSLVEQLARRHQQAVQVIPEVATALFSQVLPVPQNPSERRITQKAIYAVQWASETLYRSRQQSEQILVFDRGLLDGAAYWPDGPDAYFSELGGSAEEIRVRYDAVLHLETAAAGGYSMASGNAVRREDNEQAVVLDKLLFDLWSPHPQFVQVPHARTFDMKMDKALAVLEQLLEL